MTVAGIGIFLLLPREVITTFDLRSHRVVHHVSIGGGWYEHRRTYAFAEIAGGNRAPTGSDRMKELVLRAQTQPRTWPVEQQDTLHPPPHQN